MDKVEMRKGIYWVGGIDWDLRDFHGYKTQRGSTYNAYLIIDDKVTLVDTVKWYLFDEMLARIKEIVDPSRIDYIVSNHVEMDHSGSIPRMLEEAPDATVITSTRGEAGLKRHYRTDLRLKVVGSGDVLNIGKRNLHFVHTPMVHWPDNMVTYIPEERLLLSNDAFGQHIASTERFDDELCWEILREEAGKYYANIVLPYGSQVKKALEALKGIDVDMIGPSHGAIWRSHIPKIMDEYKKWCDHQTEARALIVYDTMWDSTKKMAYALREGLLDAGVPVTVRSLKSTHISDIMTDVLTARLILIGSPTLNNGLLPSMGAFLTYLKGLRPAKRVGLAFGSYGWGGQAVGMIEDIMKELGWDMPEKGHRLKYVPDPEELVECRAMGKRLGKHITSDRRSIQEEIS